MRNALIQNASHLSSKLSLFIQWEYQCSAGDRDSQLVETAISKIARYVMNKDSRAELIYER